MNPSTPQACAPSDFNRVSTEPALSQVSENSREFAPPADASAAAAAGSAEAALGSLAVYLRSLPCGPPLAPRPILGQGSVCDRIIGAGADIIPSQDLLPLPMCRALRRQNADPAQHAEHSAQCLGFRIDSYPSLNPIPTTAGQARRAERAQHVTSFPLENFGGGVQLGFNPLHSQRGLPLWGGLTPLDGGGLGVGGVRSGLVSPSPVSDWILRHNQRAQAVESGRGNMEDACKPAANSPGESQG